MTLEEIFSGDEVRIATFLEKMWSRVTVGADTECWLWQGGATDQGYGRVKYKDGTKQKSLYPHRVAYMQTYGEIPDGHYVCHMCDTPSCCNPLHLWVGTAQQNSDDMVAKGRSEAISESKRGNTWNRSLTTERVEEILRLLHIEGLRGSHVASRFGLADSTVSLIRRGKTYSDIYARFMEELNRELAS